VVENHQHVQEVTEQFVIVQETKNFNVSSEVSNLAMVSLGKAAMAVLGNGMLKCWAKFRSCRSENLAKTFRNERG